jgi:ATP-dependent DNA helicase RecG
MNAAREGFTSQLKSLVTPQMQTLIDYLKVHQSASDEEVQSLLNVKRTRAFNLTKQMSELGLVSIIGRGKNRKIAFIKTE